MFPHVEITLKFLKLWKTILGNVDGEYRSNQDVYVELEREIFKSVIPSRR
jgi:hypothetical protein